MILTDSNKKWLADKIDEAIILNGLLELVDGYAAKVILQVIDQKVESKVTISEFLKEKLNEIVDAAREKNIEKVEELTTVILDSLIDIPGIDDESEKLLFEGAVKMVVGAIHSYLKK